MRRNVYLEFLKFIDNGEILIEDLCEDLEIDKHNIHRYIRRAEADGLNITKRFIHGGLYSIQITNPMEDIYGLNRYYQKD